MDSQLSNEAANNANLTDLEGQPTTNQEDQSSTFTTIDNTFLYDTIHKVGHDLRSPLFVCRSYAHLLQKTEDPEIKQRGFKLIDEATYTMEATIDGLVQLMDVYTAPKLEINTINIVDAIEKTKLLLAKELDECKPSFLTDISLEEINFNEEYLVTVLKESISNAVKHNANKADLQIKISCKKNEDNQVIISVEDNGAGLPDSIEHQLLFQPFYKIGGDAPLVGVGLAKIDAIAKLHNCTRAFVEIENGCRLDFIINER